MSVVETPAQPGFLNKKTIANPNTNIPDAAIFLKRTAIEFLQVLFSTRAPGSYHYDQDDSQTEIQICDQHSLDLEAINVRPSIVGVRGPLSGQNMGLGGNNTQAQNRLTGNTTLTDLLIGSVAFSCVSREGTEAERLASLVFNSFKYFAKPLRTYGFFHIKSLNIGGETVVEQEGYEDLFLVPVFITASVQDRWVLSDTVATKLENIIFTTLRL